MKSLLHGIRKNKIVLILVVALAGIAYFGQKLVGSNTVTQTDSGTVNATVTKGTLTSSVSASGTIQTANYLAVTTSVNGIVKKVYVTEGEKVSEGQKIMEITLDSEGERGLAEAYSSYLRAKNALDSAKTSLYASETTMLQKKEAFEDEKVANSYQTHDERLSYKYAENEYLKAKSDYEIQKSSIKQLEIALESAYSEYKAQSPTVTAAASGVVANILAVEGTKIENSVTSDRSVMTVASIKQEGTPIASVDVTEMDINSIKVGQKILMTLSSIEGQTFEGKVTGIDKIGSSESGVSNYPVIIKFDTDSELVLPNMSVDAEIVIAQKENALYIPTSAIKTVNGKKTVNLAKGDSMQPVNIETGIVAGTNTEVLSGLSEGETILVDTLPTSGFTSTSTSQQRNPGIPGIGGGIGR